MGRELIPKEVSFFIIEHLTKSLVWFFLCQLNNYSDVSHWHEVLLCQMLSAKRKRDVGKLEHEGAAYDELCL